jgi:hypothetical protein
MYRRKISIVVALAAFIVAAAGSQAFAATSLESVQQQADTKPPSVPQNLRTSQVLGGQAVISWDASVDDSGQIYHYWVLVDGHQRARPAATTYQIADLVKFDRITAGPHIITVQAVDRALNRSAPSSPVQIVVF